MPEQQVGRQRRQREREGEEQRHGDESAERQGHGSAEKPQQRHAGVGYPVDAGRVVSPVGDQRVVSVQEGVGHPREEPRLVRYVPAFLAAGPGPIVRGLRVTAVQDRGHPEDEHVFLWLLAVDPAHQRAGAGRALLARVFEDAEAPVYLDTSNPANVPYYASAGFEEIGRGTLPRDTPMWFMRRP